LTAPLRVLDLCCGLGGASAAFRDAGDYVVTVDIEPRFRPTVIADVRAFHPRGRWDVILASPPCYEFSPWAMPVTWARGGRGRKVPDLTIVEACRRIAADHPEAVFVMENVRGAVRWIGKPSAVRGSRYLWGDVGLLSPVRAYGKWRLPPSPDRKDRRSMWPYPLSVAVRSMAVGMVR
jgi:site-specific DNA-cytosine methylase